MVRGADPYGIVLPASSIKTEIGSDAFHGGLVYAKSASMHMGKFAAGLAGAAARRGARIYEGAPVTKLRRIGGRHDAVVSGRRAGLADPVLLATRTSAEGALFHFSRRLVP